MIDLIINEREKEFIKDLFVKIAVYGGFAAIIFYAVYVFLSAIGG